MLPHEVDVVAADVGASLGGSVRSWTTASVLSTQAGDDRKRDSRGHLGCDMVLWRPSYK